METKNENSNNENLTEIQKIQRKYQTKTSTEAARTNFFKKNFVMLKLITVTILMLLLLIPTSMVKSIIKERESLNREAVQEVSAKWANQQTIKGPILTIPVSYRFVDGEKETFQQKDWNISPDDLEIDGEVTPEKLRRGIYEVVVYKSALEIKGNFDLQQELDTTNLHQIHYDKAFLTIGITDLRGIKNDIKVTWGNTKLDIVPGSKISYLIPNGITVKLPLIDTVDNKINFRFNLDLQGSKNLAFVPLGSSTEVKLRSGWKSPKFIGNYLPDDRTVDKDGFSARWKILEMNKSYPQSWIGAQHIQAINQSNFSVDLILPLDDYQKSIRSVKYAAMTIALTFLIFFLIEVLGKHKIHPFQYILVGLALCLFYTLLVSISEHTDFNAAYGISTLGIVSLISLYSLSIFKVKKMTLLLIATLMGIYGFLFVTLQLADYALLMGSIGLLLILATTMYFTRKINWYQIHVDEH